MKTIGTLLILCCVFCVSNAVGQNRKSWKSKENLKETVVTPCGGGVVNGMAIKLPKPIYSNEAKLAEAKGVVSVQVKIDEEGNVIEARVCGGNPLLRDAAVQAAKQAKFKPTTFGGNPVKVSGAIVYHFGSENSKNNSEAKIPNENVVVLPCPPNKGFRILNNYAINLVKPEYPDEEKEKGLRGGVIVHVMLDEQGKITAAEAVSGPQELRKYAIEATNKSTFKRFILCGKPTHIIGGIIYNFVP